MLVRLVKLVADKRRDARLDPAGPERDQAQPDKKSGAIMHEERETRLADAIDQAEPKDRVIFSKETIGQPAAKQREEVNANDKCVKDILGGVLTICFGQIRQKRCDQAHRQDVAHPVKAEALAAFVADDVSNLARDRGLGI